MQYRLYTYDVWGNARDGWQVNDVFRTRNVINIDEDTSNQAINRRLGGKGIVWEGEHEYTLYGVTKRGKPIAELRPE